MFYTIYQITNLLDGKIYIGKHQTKNLNDGYMGSGKRVKYAITKYGVENFKKEILFVFDNEQEMNAKEIELVTEEFCIRDDTYNLATGGRGGFSYLDENGKMVYPFDKPGARQAGRKAANEKIKEKYGSIEAQVRIAGKIGIKKLKEKLKTDPVFKQKMLDNARLASKKAASLEAREKRKMTMKNNGHAKGSKNSQFGTMWITNGTENKKIKKDIDIIPEGWYKGRS